MNNIAQLTIKGVTAVQDMHERIADVKALIEQRLNLDEYTENVRPVTLNQSNVLRICLLAGLSDKSKRVIDDATKSLTLSRTPYATTFFTKSNIGDLFEALLKLRYHDVDADWTAPKVVSRVIGREILRGRDILLKEGAIDVNKDGKIEVNLEKMVPTAKKMLTEIIQSFY